VTEPHTPKAVLAGETVLTVEAVRRTLCDVREEDMVIAVSGIHEFVAVFQALDAALGKIIGILRVEHPIAELHVFAALEVKRLCAVPTFDEFVPRAVLRERLVNRDMWKLKFHWHEALAQIPDFPMCERIHEAVEDSPVLCLRNGLVEDMQALIPEPKTPNAIAATVAVSEKP
jgi:hypothetical protein